jgi:cobaltochelatase CobN
VVENHHFDQLYDAYIADETVRGFVAAHNPDALVEMSRRFAEAIDRGLWTPRLNSAALRLAELSQRRPP